MTKIYSYVIRVDSGAAPNPYWGSCTLTICKPVIRKKAMVGDWVIGTGSKNTKLKDGKIHDLSLYLVYAMKVSKVLSLSEYDKYCRTKLKGKLPDCNNKDWRRKVGDCIYDYSTSVKPKLRKSVHNERNRKRDLNGLNALLSRHFYYFGEEPVLIPGNLADIIKINQGHKKIVDAGLIQEFEQWIENRKKNKIYAEPQLKKGPGSNPCTELKSRCMIGHKETEEDDQEEVVTKRTSCR